MADPAENREEPVYDQPGNAPSRPQLQKLEGGGQTSAPTGNLNSVPSGGDDLKQQEEKPGRHLNAVPDQAAHENQVGKGYTPTSNFPVGFRDNPRRWLIKNRRKAVGGGGVVGTIIGLMLFFTIGSGPLQFIHLSHILQRHFAGNENTSSIRLKGLYRYAKSGQIGETRVGAVGSKIFGSSIDQLKSVGIEFQANKQGYIRTATLDPAKLESKFPEMKGMTDAEKQTFLADKFNLDESLFSTKTLPDGTRGFSVDASSLGIKATRALVNNSLDVLDGGKVLTAIRGRVLTKYYDLPSLYHPLQRARAAIKNKLSGKAAVAAEQKAQEDRIKAIVDEPVTAPEGASARSTVNDALASKALANILIAQAGLCAIHDAAGAAITYNRAAIVVAAALQAADKNSLGEQIEAGNDFDLSQLNPIASNFVDSNGQSIWDAKSLQVTAGQTNATGKDLPADYGQAFSSNTTADKIKEETTIKDPVFGTDITAAACSQVGLFVGLVISVAAIVAAIPTDGGTAAGLFALEAGVKAAATGGVMYMVSSQVKNLSESKAIVPAIMSGPLGGNILAYGARELANIDARASGGVALDNSNKSVTSAALDAQYQQEFNSKSWFAKIFDAKDYRSATGKLIDNSTPSLSKNIAKMGTNLFHFGNIFSGVANVFSGKAAAASSGYDWGSPRYGIPDSIANNPAYEDPYANAQYVAQNLLTDQTYVGKAAKCFGVDISSKDADGKWQVVPSSDVNPGSSDYTESNCNDTSDSNWQRIMLYIFDSRTMDAAACYDGDQQYADQSCANNGIGAAVINTTTPTGSGVSGSAQQIAQQILSNKNILLSGREVANDVQAAANGKPGSAGVATSATILQLILNVGQKRSVTISAIQSGGTGHCNDTPKSACPTDPHYTGDGVDFSAVDGVALSGRDAGSLAIMQIAFPLLPTGSGFGQSQCGGTPNLPSGDITFTDTCNHLHVQVPPGTP